MGLELGPALKLELKPQTRTELVLQLELDPEVQPEPEFNTNSQFPILNLCSTPDNRISVHCVVFTHGNSIYYDIPVDYDANAEPTVSEA